MVKSTILANEVAARVGVGYVLCRLIAVAELYNRWAKK